LAGAASCDHPLEIHQSTGRQVPNIKRLHMKRLNSTPALHTRKEIRKTEFVNRIQESEVAGVQESRIRSEAT
jgi:hypothetical protein